VKPEKPEKVWIRLEVVQKNPEQAPEHCKKLLAYLEILIYWKILFLAIILTLLDILGRCVITFYPLVHLNFSPEYHAQINIILAKKLTIQYRRITRYEYS